MAALACVLLPHATGCTTAWHKPQEQYYFRQPTDAARAAAGNSQGAEPNAPPNDTQPAASRGQQATPVAFDAPAQQQAAQAEAAGGVALPPYGEEPDEGQGWLERSAKNLAPKRVWNRFLTAIGQGPDEPLAHRLFAEGDERFRQREYLQAAKRYKAAARRWPDSTLEEDALFMLAESYFFADRYAKASDAYANLLRKYENSRHIDAVTRRQFAIGRYWDSLMQAGKAKGPFNLTDHTRPFFDTWGNTHAIYESIPINDPTSPLADDATLALANLNYLKGRYEDAAYNYDLLRKNYSQSEHQPIAHLLGLNANLLAYQGPQYDAAPLERAEELANQALSQFALPLAHERERLLAARAAIREERARRDFEAGEYYYRLRYYRAAREYYQHVIREFGDTTFAARAQARMQETANLPPVPPDRLKWLYDWIPTSKRRS
ncbi:MAG: outer membrane protein assembly factor BamD [Pirellulales bacterium]|nr:outer membrane protein assembly factor BamD [Pirellulales bacterium]